MLQKAEEGRDPFPIQSGRYKERRKFTQFNFPWKVLAVKLISTTVGRIPCRLASRHFHRFLYVCIRGNNGYGIEYRDHDRPAYFQLNYKRLAKVGELAVMFCLSINKRLNGPDLTTMNA